MSIVCDTGFINIVDLFLNPDSTVWTGSITYTLQYATTVAGATLVEARQVINVSDGIDICLAPGLYTVVYNQSGQRLPVTSQWTVPPTGGPYTIADLEGDTGAITTALTVTGAFSALGTVTMTSLVNASARPYVATNAAGLLTTGNLALVAISGSASDLASGTVPAARGGAGTLTGILTANGAGVVTALTTTGSGTVVALATAPVFVGLSSSGTTQSTSITTGDIVTAGGIGIAKNAYVGGALTVTGAIAGGTLEALTPVLRFGGATTGITYSTQSGTSYTIGNLVFVTLRIVLISKGSATGSAKISGFPVTAVADAVGAVQAVNGMAGLNSEPICFLQAGDNGITLQQINSNTGIGSGSQGLLDTDFTNTTELRLSILYTK